MKIKRLSETQRVTWYSASAVFGICLVVLGFTTSAFSSGQAFPFIIFAACWLAGILLLRLFLQQFDRPGDLRKFLWRRRAHEE